MMLNDLPGAPYLQVFTLPSPILGESTLTSVVIDKDAFDALIGEFAFQPRLSGMTEDDVRQFIESTQKENYLPMVYRGSATEWIFRKLGVTTKLMSMIVRGHGPELAKGMLGGSPAA